jgi:flagellar basal body-associated protein FliL
LEPWGGVVAALLVVVVVLAVVAVAVVVVAVAFFFLGRACSKSNNLNSSASPKGLKLAGPQERVVSCDMFKLTVDGVTLFISPQ